MKILVAGDVLGQFKTLFARVQTVLRKTSEFDMLLCVGEFFVNTTDCIEQWKDIKEGKVSIPLPMFILGPSSPDCIHFYDGISADGGELCEHITCLGQRGLYTTSSGLQLAYLSGCYEESEYKKTSTDNTKLSPYFTEDDITSLCELTNNDSYNGVDILLTSEWPQGIFNFVTPPETLSNQRVGSLSVSKLAVSLLPRYHFVGKMQTFYERPPYRNHEVLSGQQKQVTRFISLSNVGNPDKKNRYLYAFSVTPLKQMDHKDLIQQPEAVTDSPYKEILKSKRPTEEQSVASNFFFDAKEIEATRKQQQREQERLMRQFDPSLPPAKRRPNTRPPPQPRGPCWFCLSSPEVEKHLIVSIGNHSYLALGKGGLLDEHILILPIGHYPSSVDTPQEVMEEIIMFKQSLKKYFESKKQCCVMYERNFRSQHLQIQVVPLPVTDGNILRQAFIDHGKQHKVEFAEIDRSTDLNKMVPSGAPYFIVEFSDGPSLLARIKGFFPIQFGREVLASPLILNVPNKVNWKNCTLSKEEETEMTLKFRDNFQPFDFTLEDD